MTGYRLGINTCFAVKRWPQPERWARLVRDELELDLVQHSLDLVDLDAPPAAVEDQAARLRAACAYAGLTLHSTFTGLAAYSANLLLHPDQAARDRARGWYRRVIGFTADPAHVPVLLCLDVGHQCVPGTAGPDRDPYAWLERFGARAPVVQLQQTDGTADHHSPFTLETNAAGIIEPAEVLAALDRSGAADTALILEIIPPFEQDDDQVLEDLRQSAAYWRAALRHHAGG